PSETWCGPLGGGERPGSVAPAPPVTAQDSLPTTHNRITAIITAAAAQLASTCRQEMSRGLGDGLGFSETQYKAVAVKIAVAEPKREGSIPIPGASWSQSKASQAAQAGIARKRAKTVARLAPRRRSPLARNSSIA